MRTVASIALFWAFSASAQAPLPPDIDAQSYSRLPLILKDSLDAEGRRIFEAINGREGNVPRLGPPASSLYSLPASEPYDELNVLLRKASVGPQFFEIGTLVPAREFNQQYEWSAHEVGARRVGVSDQVINVIKYDRPVTGLPEKEATVIEYGRAMLRGDRQVPAELFAKMVALFGRQGTIEITMIMGDYTMTAMLLNAVDQHLPPGREPLLPPRGAIAESKGAPVVAHPNPLAALASRDRTLAANKRLVFDMWRSIVDAGHVELADDMLAEGYIQHSPVLRTGRAAFEQIFSAVPRRDIPALVEPPLVASVAEGDLVVMSLLESIPARDGAAAHTTTHFNLFRIAAGRLAEHWHSVQTAPGADVPLPSEGGPQPVTGTTGVGQLALLESQDRQLAANKRLVFDMWREIVDAGQEQLADRYLDEGFIEHNPNAATGREGFKAYFAMRADRPVEPMIRAPVVAIVAEGDLVVLVTMREHAHPSRAGLTYTTTWFDMFRIAAGRLVEHWDAAQL
jgi:predicted SnoaL-like aldol condensation-catalyzing enzyme